MRAQGAKAKSAKEPNPETKIRPNELDNLLARWGGFFVSKSLVSSQITFPYQHRFKRLLVPQLNGLRFEKQVILELSRRDFTTSLSNFFSLPPSTSYLIIHNPNFIYKLRNKKKLCIPDALIFASKSLPDSISLFKSLFLLTLNPKPKSKYLVSINTLNPLFSSLTPPDVKRRVRSPLDPIFSSSPLDSIFLEKENHFFTICVEVKLTYVPSAISKLKTLYLPVVHKAFSLPVFPLIIVKNLTISTPKPSSVLSSALGLEVPVLNYLGFGKIY
jgi:hypothetical protein